MRAAFIFKTQRPVLSQGSLKGGICSHTLTSEKSTMTFEQFVAFLEADEAQKKGAAICMSATDWGTLKTELETACRELGGRCSYAIKALIETKPVSKIPAPKT